MTKSYKITLYKLPIIVMVKISQNIELCEFSTQTLYRPLSSSVKLRKDTALNPFGIYFAIG